MQLLANTSALSRAFILLDLLIAAVLFFQVEPLARFLHVPASGCAGLATAVWAWGSGAVVVTCAMWLLVYPRSGRWVAIVLGLLSLVVGTWLTLDGMRFQPARTILMTSVLGLPAVAQSVMGAVLLRWDSGTLS